VVIAGVAENEAVVSKFLSSRRTRGFVAKVVNSPVGVLTVVESVTGPVKPFKLVIAMFAEPVAAALKIRLVGLTERSKS